MLLFGPLAMLVAALVLLFACAYGWKPPRLSSFAPARPLYVLCIGLLLGLMGLAFFVVGFFALCGQWVLKHFGRMAPNAMLFRHP